ncbi:hypothetical protein [Streptococcus lactarius]|nr:hypothetical protein [Streptococcus lactarius]QUB39655.1 hypothetical protein J4854_04215 [Streptococcus lactarius]
MNKRTKKKQLEIEVKQLKSELFLLSSENLQLFDKLNECKTELNTLSQALKRHEVICEKNIEQTNKEFDSIKKELKRSKKSFFKR